MSLLIKLYEAHWLFQAYILCILALVIYLIKSFIFINNDED